MGIEVSASATCITSRPHVLRYDFAMLTDPTMLDEQLSSVFRAPYQREEAECDDRRRDDR